MRGVSRLRTVSRAALQARATVAPGALPRAHSAPRRAGQAPASRGKDDAAATRTARAVASVSAATQYVRNRAVQSAVDALADKFSAPKTRVFRDESALVCASRLRPGWPTLTVGLADPPSRHRTSPQ